MLTLNSKARLVVFSNESRKCFGDLDAFVVVCIRILGIFFDSCLLRRVDFVPGSVQPLFRSSKAHDEI